MTIALGLWFSFGVGVADFLGGFVARRSQALATVASAMVAGTVVMALLLTVVGGTFTATDAVLGLASGSLIGFALTSLYRGISDASAAVVAPIAAVLAAVIPFGWDLAAGGSLPALGIVGAVVAFAGLALTTSSPELGERVRVGVGWGLIAGVCFGVSLTFLGETSEDGGLWPAVIQRATALAVLLATGSLARLPVFVPRAMWVWAALSGTLGATAIAAFTVGAQQGSLAEIAAVTALAPAVTAGLSALLDGHPMRWWQVLGAGVSAAGVALVGLA